MIISSPQDFSRFWNSLFTTTLVYLNFTLNTSAKVESFKMSAILCTLLKIFKWISSLPIVKPSDLKMVEKLYIIWHLNISHLPWNLYCLYKWQDCPLTSLTYNSLCLKQPFPRSSPYLNTLLSYFCRSPKCHFISDDFFHHLFTVFLSIPLSCFIFHSIYLPFRKDIFVSLILYVLLKYSLLKCEDCSIFYLLLYPQQLQHCLA